MSTQLTFAFNGKNEAAQSAAAKHAAWLVAGVSEDTRKALRALVAKSIREGVPPLEAARSIRTLVGLNAPQALAASKYEAELRLNGLSPERVEKALEFYTARKVKERADTISRTETLSALNAGSLEGWKQAQKKGFLSRGARKTFLTTPDEKLCPICRPMNKQEQPLGKPFVKPDGSKIMFPPAHPRCRCTMSEPTAPGARKKGLSTLEEILAQGTNWLSTGRIIDRVRVHPPAHIFDMLLQGEGTDFRHGLWKGEERTDQADMFRQEDFMGILSSVDRELLATGIARVLGVSDVPLGVARVVRLGSKLFKGIMMDLIPNVTPFEDIEMIVEATGIPYPEIPVASRDAGSVFDILTANFDRHLGNLLFKVPAAFIEARATLSLLSDEFEKKARDLFSNPLHPVLIDNAYTFGFPMPGPVPTAYFSPAEAQRLRNLGLTKMNNTNELTNWWMDPAPSFSLRSMSKDSGELWRSKLFEKKDALFHLVGSSGLTELEKKGFRSRFAAVIDALSIGRFAELAREAFNGGRSW